MYTASLRVALDALDALNDRRKVGDKTVVIQQAKPAVFWNPACLVLRKVRLFGYSTQAESDKPMPLILGTMLSYNARDTLRNSTL